MSDRTPMTAIERGLAAKLATARFPPGTASKRFARNLGDGYITELSPKGRRFMAFIVHRFRRQYVLTSEELDWIAEWITYEQWSNSPQPLPVSAQDKEEESRQMTLMERYGVTEIA